MAQAKDLPGAREASRTAFTARRHRDLGLSASRAETLSFSCLRPAVWDGFLVFSNLPTYPPPCYLPPQVATDWLLLTHGPATLTTAYVGSRACVSRDRSVCLRPSQQGAAGQRALRKQGPAIPRCSPLHPQPRAETYGDDVPLQAVGRVSALDHGTQLGVAHSRLGAGGAHRTWVGKEAAPKEGWL